MKTPYPTVIAKALNDWLQETGQFIGIIPGSIVLKNCRTFKATFVSRKL